MAALVAAPAAAQAPGGEAAVGVGTVVESYVFADPGAAGIASIVLVTTPFAARAELPYGVGVEMAGAWARGALQRRGGTLAHLSGLTDTHLRVWRTFGRDRLTLALIAQLPTGHARHTAAEAEVADAVAADLLPFRVSNWGTGGGVGMSAAYAARVAGFGVGASAGYVRAGRFEPFAEAADDAAYRPGDETVLRVAADRTVGRSGKAGVQATWQHYAEDRFAGRNLYRAGDRLQVVASYRAGVGPATGVVYGGVLHREDGTSLDLAAPGTPVQDLWLGGAAARFAFGWGAITPGVEGRLFRSGDGRGQGWFGGVGATAEIEARRFILLPTARLRLGEVVVDDDADTGFTGVELGLTVRRSLR
ncbi:MAG TPA: hypothetical protein VFX98_12480 [Longimicrobiaceae bacterium]|nr:hypothetical protein [Longimicrobiaceae bacterium]